MSHQDEILQYHFIGIGGIGMSALARLLFLRGFTVTGSDAHESAQTRQLEKEGIRVYLGHGTGQVPDSGAVVYSSSISTDNCEWIEARKKGLKILHRSELLGLLSNDYWALAVAGSHGKTTTTTLSGRIFERAGLDPVVVVGAKITEWGGNLRLGAGDRMILEADESDASFLNYSPNVIVVTNIDNDHLDHYKDMDHLRQTFGAFIRRLKPGGFWVGCRECPEVRKLIETSGRPVVTYGWDNRSDYYATDIQSLGPDGMRFVLQGPRGALGPIRIGLLGMHNVLNYVGAAAAALESRLSKQSILSSSGDFRGASRRLEIKAESASSVLFDDYGHHPTEIAATLRAARTYAARPLIVFFEPHRYSRTQILENDFVGAFDEADEVFITDIYSAGEKPIPAISAERLVERIRQTRGHVHYIPKTELAGKVREIFAGSATVVMMGAGSIGEAAQAVAAELAGQVMKDVERKDFYILDSHEGRSQWNALADKLKKHCGGTLLTDESLDRHTTIKIGGKADLWFEPRNADELEASLAVARDEGCPVHVIGGGSNILVPDTGLEGLVLHLNTPSFKTLKREGDLVHSGAGVPLARLLAFLVEEGFGECEFMAGIPAQVGGAVVMNAGSAKRWMGDFVRTVKLVSLRGEAGLLKTGDIQFGYRRSSLQDAIVTDVELAFPQVDSQITRKNLEEYSGHRRKTQDLRFPNAGCMFANPAQGCRSAGQLIDESGLKGFRVGEAQVSDVHANFVVNRGHATYGDVLKLMEAVEEKVFERFHVRLRREIRILR